MFLTQIFILIFWGVFLLEVLLSKSITPSLEVLVSMGGLAPILLSEKGNFYRFFTHMFLHGGFLHVTMNSIALYFGGRFLEAIVGRFLFGLVFILSGYGAALVASIFSDPRTVLIGASGAVMGVLGALVATAFLLPKSPLRKNLIQNSGQIIIPSLIPIFSGVSYSAHMGGLVSGLFLGLLLFFIRKG